MIRARPLLLMLMSGALAQAVAATGAAAASEGELAIGARAARAQTAVALQLSWLHSVQFAGSYIALQNGWWREAGLEVSLLQGGPNAPVEPPVVAGTALVGISAADYAAAAVAQGAQRVTATAETPGPAYVAPMVLAGLDHSMTIMRDELFGPVACVQRVHGDAEALALMNDSDYGLSASIWTADEERGLELLDQVEAGTVYLNRCDHADLYLPWGGVKTSGMGRTNGRLGLAGTTHAKAFHIRKPGA